MLKENIPYKVIGSMYFYKRKEIKDLLSYLNVIYNSNDDISLLRVINVPKRGIGAKTIENLSIQADLLNQSIYSTIEAGKELEFKKIIEDIKANKDNMSLTELVDYVLDKSGMRKEFEEQAGNRELCREQRNSCFAGILCDNVSQQHCVDDGA